MKSHRDTELCAALLDGEHLLEKFGDADTAHFVRGRVAVPVERSFGTRFFMEK